jgi:hypothetical protein
MTDPENPRAHWACEFRQSPLWNIDKHRHLVPIHLIAQGPSLKLTNAVVLERVPDRFDGNTYVVELTAIETEAGLDPHVDVEPHTPTDIAFSDGAPVVHGLRDIGQLIIIRVLLPIRELFPGDLGVGLP